MIVKILGIDYDFEISEGISLINIHNKALYRSLTQYLLYSLTDDDSRNDLVILDENKKRIPSKKIRYIHDTLSYKFDSKQIIDRLVKPYVASCISSDVHQKEKEIRLYNKLLEPVLEFVSTLDIDYEYKEELDSGFYLKLAGFDFSVNDDQPIIDKVISIIRIVNKIDKNPVIILNRATILLDKDELNQINDFCVKNSVILLLIDYLDDSEVVIANNLVISPDFGAYMLKMA